MFVAVAIGLVAFYEGYKWIWETAGFTRPFEVERPHDAAHLGHRRPALRALAAKRPAAHRGALGRGALHGEGGGGRLRARRDRRLPDRRPARPLDLLRRGLLPYVVASQTIPILAIAPMVVIWLGGRGLPTWFPVSVIAAYLTFFPVTINAIRGLELADPRALDLMNSYAAGRWAVLWKLRSPRRSRISSPPSRSPRRPASSAPSSVSCLRRSRTASAAPSSTSTSTTPPRPRASGRRTDRRGARHLVLPRRRRSPRSSSSTTGAGAVRMTARGCGP